MAATQQAQPGSLFGAPQLSQFFEIYDNQVSFATTLSQANQTVVNGLGEFSQDHIVFWWELEMTLATTVTAGTGQTVTISPYFPFNIFATLTLALQSMYNNIQVQNGFDAALFQLIRPMRKTDTRNMMGAAPANTTTTIPWATGIQTNQWDTPAPTTSTTSTLFTLELPGSLFMDAYWDFTLQGALTMSAPVRACVSPQYMAGAARLIKPQITYAPAFGGGLDANPYVTTALTASGDTASTFSGTATITMRRVGVYALQNPAVDPPQWNWQYVRIAKQYASNAQNTRKITLDQTGQIMSLFFRWWDPTTTGSAIDLMANLQYITLTYGGGLTRFADSPKSMQRRFWQQHGFLLPTGVLCWDLGVDTDGSGRITNAYCLNTLITANPTVTFQWNANYTPVAAAYLTIGYEMLSYVSAE